MHTILFDLDGTLLPMDEQTFTKVYFHELCQTVAPLGFQPDELVNAIWAGTKAMVQNDGSLPNVDRFWTKFVECIPCDLDATRAACDAFYSNQFHNARAATLPAPLSSKLVRMVREKGYKTALATNPVFPLMGVATRLGWVGLTVDDFDLVTSYENSCYCKPNPKYYESILDHLGAKPEDCLMVGNNVSEDMCFEKLGGRVFLLNGHVENPKGLDTSGFPQGDFEALAKQLEALPRISR